jgi:hypothetical protein
MIRIVRAAGFAAAAVALVAAASYSEPARAGETVTAASVTDAGKPAEPKAGEASLFSKVWASVGAFVSAPDSGTASPRRSLDQLVTDYHDTAPLGREQECLANAVYFEARGESLEGQLAVAQVVMNRAASGRYPSDLCGVVTQPAQFSFIRHGRFPSADRSSQAWHKAVAVAEIARSKLADRLPAGVLWYHATYVSPSWGKRLTRQGQIGLHIFYS